MVLLDWEMGYERIRLPVWFASDVDRARAGINLLRVSLSLVEIAVFAWIRGCW